MVSHLNVCVDACEVQYGKGHPYGLPIQHVRIEFSWPSQAV